MSKQVYVFSHDRYLSSLLLAPIPSDKRRGRPLRQTQLNYTIWAAFSPPSNRCIINEGSGAKEQTIPAIDKEGLKSIFEFVNEIRGVDFALYRHATVTRKLELRLSETGSHDYRIYLSYLKSHPDELDKLIRALTIKVSNFFRNPLVYELLFASVLPDLISEFGFLKIWSLGCAYGEEPYSVAILVRELLRRDRGNFDVKILGTDIDAGAIEKGVLGEFAEGELEEVKKKYLDSCFREVVRQDPPVGHESAYWINNEIKSMVKLECADIVMGLEAKKKQGSNYNLILCRNVLIYMDKVLQQSILRNISDLIPLKGYLVIGESETLPSSGKDEFSQVFPGMKIFRKTA
ncbi:MAG: protein-glutamate O-methyltransferase CheR [Nitrospiraceae bacterium]|nr:protein-glutamate O-methyltransferase CheR [Nitrospiraceae bacterium]